VQTSAAVLCKLQQLCCANFSSSAVQSEAAVLCKLQQLCCANFKSCNASTALVYLSIILEF
jgi:hypothetical protein